MIRTIRPSFGEMKDSVSQYIKDYLDYYNLNIDLNEYRCGYVKTRQEQLFVQRFGLTKEKGTVLLLHGYLDHTGALSKTIHFLTESGYNVICFDLIGHGLSSGERVSIQCFSDYIDSLAVIYENLLKNEQKQLHLIAHSTGAAIGLKYIEQNQDAFGKVILISPLFRPYLWTLSKVGLVVAKPFIQNIKRKFTKNSGDPAFIQFTREDPLQEKTLPFAWLTALNEEMFERKKQGAIQNPLSFLMIQGDKDKTIHTKYGFNWAMEHYPHSSFILMHGGRHHLLNEKRVVREQMHALIIKYLER